MRWVRSRRAMLVAAVLGAALILPQPAAADWWDPPAKHSYNMKLTISKVYYMNALTMDVYAVVQCDDRGGSWTGAEAWVKQVGAGRKIAFGMATSGYAGVTCDGAPHEIFLRITAEPAGIAFKPGALMASFAAYACRWDCQSAATGWVEVRSRTWSNRKPWPEPPPVSPPMSGPISGPMAH